MKHWFLLSILADNQMAFSLSFFSLQKISQFIFPILLLTYIKIRSSLITSFYYNACITVLHLQCFDTLNRGMELSAPAFIGIRVLGYFKGKHVTQCILININL